MSVFDSDEVAGVRHLNTFERYGAMVLGSVLVSGSLYVIFTQTKPEQRDLYAYIVLVSAWSYFNVKVNESILAKEDELRALEK